MGRPHSSAIRKSNHVVRNQLSGNKVVTSTTCSAQLTPCLRDLARHFKTDPTALFWDTRKHCLQSQLKLYSY
jgi:hypothetical protein